MLIVSGCVAVEEATVKATDSVTVEETSTPVEPEPSVELFQPVPPDIEVLVTWETLVERSDELSKIVYDDVHATIKRNKQIEGYNEILYTFYRSPNLDDIHFADIDVWLDDLFALYANTVQPDRETYIALPYEDLALISAPYSVDGQIVGTLGVIGPTRMAYDRVIPIVDITSKLLSGALSS